MPASLTPLACALLGLLHQEPRSGYALRRVFASTPMAHHSDSPGSIYPALRRLEKLGLILARNARERRGPQARILRPSAAGVRALRRWLLLPLTADDVTRRIEELMLRFAFMERCVGPAAAIRFLESYGPLVEAHLANLCAFRDGGMDEAMLSERLALESGIALYRARAAWAAEALGCYRRPAAQRPAPRAAERNDRDGKEGGR